MSLSSRPNLLRAAVQSRALWLAVPAIAALILLAFLGHWAVNTPAPISVAEAEPAAQAATEPVKAPEATRSPRRPRRPSPPSSPPTRRKRSSRSSKAISSANPEIFVDIQNALEEKMEKEQTEKLKAAISQNSAEIYRERNASVAGNPDGDITVVEFFDYNCGYCKRGLHDVVKLVETDPKVRCRVQGAADPVEGFRGGFPRRARRAEAGQVLGAPPGHAWRQGPDERGRGAADRGEARPRHDEAQG